MTANYKSSEVNKLLKDTFTIVPVI